MTSEFAKEQRQRYRIVVAYDGTSYVGWQAQPNGPSIQSAIEKALQEVTGEKTRVMGSGRTDSGVHAVGQAAHFDLSRRLPPGGLVKALNSHLRDDIRILKADMVRSDFDARRDAHGKEYRYFIWNAPIMPPQKRLYYAHAPQPLNMDAMRKAASMLVGKHDFSAFTANPGRVIDCKVREITELKIGRRGREIVIVARGGGFLYRMVRSIAGFLIRVGEGAIKPEDTMRILRSGVRTALVPTAPARGLFLWKVWYSSDKVSTR